MEASALKTPASHAVSSLKNNTIAASSVAQSPLFKLPRELRDHIYEYSFSGLYTPTGNGEEHIRVTKERGIPEPALLLTCKTIREEAIVLFYSRSRFNLVSHSYDPAVLLLWEAKREHLKRGYNLAGCVQGLTRVGPRRWDNLKRTLQLIHKGHHLFSAEVRRDDPLFSGEDEFIRGMFIVACSMGRYEWDEAEATLQMLRQGLVALHPRWAD
jgi:hypothetical protein